ncbi:MAG: DUF188 domain-containing protein [Coprobacillus sp.]
MRILVDGDACPNREEISLIAKQYQVEMIVFVDYAHVIVSDDYQVVTCETGHDSVDMAVVNCTQAGDLVITQDYGLAGLILSKGAYVLHVSGQMINHDNIDGLLMSRYMSAKERKKNHRVKGPAKRTETMKQLFLQQIENIIKGCQ